MLSSVRQEIDLGAHDVIIIDSLSLHGPAPSPTLFTPPLPLPPPHCPSASTMLARPHSGRRVESYQCRADHYGVGPRSADLAPTASTTHHQDAL